ncbi:MAG: hypothetical protein HS132_15325 [Planctomycetia bacterium]|nr:hypothetical protein [Planctomycetia bacterium]
MIPISSVNIACEKLPLADLNAPRVLSRRNRVGNVPSPDSITQDAEDAETILGLAGLCVDLSPGNIIDAREKYMVEIQPNKEEVSSLQISDIGMRQKGLRRPHYARLLVFAHTLVFQAACCLPLRVIAANLDGNPVTGRILFNRYSEEHGGKLVYEFLGKGTGMIIDLKRGESSRAQRHIFLGM